MPFADHFSSLAASYAAARPRYPAALYAWLASLVARHEVAWDCATGNGQAALGLARHFARVIATDASAAQIAHAEPHARVEYRVAPAERSGLADANVDLVTVAQAAHWFDHDAFHAEVRRVARPGAVIALWTYGYFTIAPEIDRLLVHDFAEGVLREHWPPERAPIADRYRSLPFPFAEIEAPPFEMSQHLTLRQLDGYFHSWSSIPRYVAALGEDPVPAVLAELGPLWGDPDTPRLARWDLSLRVGRVDASGTNG